MGSKKDPIEAKFDEDLQKAMALSMETHALEEMRKSRDTTGKKLHNYTKFKVNWSIDSIWPEIQILNNLGYLS